MQLKLNLAEEVLIPTKMLQHQMEVARVAEAGVHVGKEVGVKGIDRVGVGRADTECGIFQLLPSGGPFQLAESN